MSLKHTILPLLAALFLSAAPALAGDRAPGADNYSVSLTAEPLTVGADGVALLTFKVTGGFHWNKEYPAKATLAEGSATATPVAATKREFKQLKGDFDVSEHLATVKIPLTGKVAGKDTLRVDTRFSICTERMCLIKKASVDVALVVAP